MILSFVVFASIILIISYYLIKKLKPNLPKFLILLILSIIIFVLPFGFIQLQPSQLCFGNSSKNECSSAYQSETILVLGAGIKNNQTPTLVLQKRLDKAIEVYNSNLATIKQIIVSGDNSKDFHNEPKVMKAYLTRNGIPEKIVKEDFGGRRTMDSCYRLKNFFKVNSTIVITQGFHISRAKFLCDNVGLKTEYAVADDSSWNTLVWGYIREIPASWSALRDSIVFVPQVGSDGTESD